MFKKLLNQIKQQSCSFKLSNMTELRQIGEQLKKRAKIEGLDSVLSTWFALVQEMSDRTLGLRPFDRQLEAGYFLHLGKIVEMKTGEGKTLAATLPVSLNSLTEKGVHVVTVNDYLAERDQKAMGKLYQNLGLTVGLVQSTTSLENKRDQYAAHITYVTNSDLVFDYLRDNSASRVNELVQRPFHFCVIDEIDSILIDEARTPLILSTNEGKMNETKLILARTIALLLEKQIDFEIDSKRREIHFTEIGYQRATQALGKSLYDLEDPWVLEILNALKAIHLFICNQDYVILDNKIVIVDEFTGRMMEDRRWSLGIHEAIETKENVPIGGETETKSSITYQNFFPLYPKLAGMTGTANTANREFEEIYNLEVVVLPTTNPMIRVDLPDLIYQNEFAKWKAVLRRAKKSYTAGQPVLIGTASVQKSEFLSDLFFSAGIPHQVLNAKPENVARESEIIGQAGKEFAVTIATNMAGRGTDIVLGGNRFSELKRILSLFLFSKNELNKELYWKSLFEQEFWLQMKKQVLSTCYKGQIPFLIENFPTILNDGPESFYYLADQLQNEVNREWEKENKRVKEAGGLLVLGTERYENRRIDNQLRGRAGRQGDPGSSQFFLSLDDQLLVVFGGTKLRSWVGPMMTDPDVPMGGDFLTQALENAQKKVEDLNYEIRKNIFQYDSVLNKQRQQFFTTRYFLLTNSRSSELDLAWMELTREEEKEELFRIEERIKRQKKQNAKKNWFLTETSKEKIKTKFICYTNDLWLEKNLQIFQEKHDLENQAVSLPKQRNEPNYYPNNYQSIVCRLKRKEKLQTINQTFSSPFSDLWVDKSIWKKKRNTSWQEHRIRPEEKSRSVWIFYDQFLSQNNFYQQNRLKSIQKPNLFSSLDIQWTKHLERMTFLRETINWKAYGQQDPLFEYNVEAFQSFSFMFQEIRRDGVSSLNIHPTF